MWHSVSVTRWLALAPTKTLLRIACALACQAASGACLFACAQGAQPAEPLVVDVQVASADGSSTRAVEPRPEPMVQSTPTVPTDRPQPEVGAGSSVVPVTPSPTVSAPPPSSANNTAAARQAFAEGVNFYQQGDFTQARLAFEKAYRLAPLPRVLLNVGRAYVAEGNRPKACAAFQTFLSQVDTATHDHHLPELRLDCPGLN